MNFARIQGGILARMEAPTQVGSNIVGAAVDQASVAELLTWLDGTGADQADLYYRASGALATEEAISLDVGDGTLEVAGESVAMARVKAIYLKNTSGTAATIQLSGSNGAVGGGLVMLPGEWALRACPHATAWPVTNGVTDTIDITNLSDTLAASYSLVVVGASA